MWSAGVVPCKQALYHNLVDVVPVVAKHSFQYILGKSLMIGYNLERFANSTANLEHVTLYFDNLVYKMGHCQWFSTEYFCSIVNTYVSKWTRDGKLKLNFVRPEKK